MEQSANTIGQSVVIKGELSAKEDLTIQGHVDGKIELEQNILTIGPAGRITAQVRAKTVIVMGKVEGNITATESISINEQGAVEGDLTAPRIGIADGAHFQGSIDMQQAKAVSPQADTSSRVASQALAAAHA